MERTRRGSSSVVPFPKPGAPGVRPPVQAIPPSPAVPATAPAFSLAAPVENQPREPGREVQGSGLQDRRAAPVEARSLGKRRVGRLGESYGSE